MATCTTFSRSRPSRPCEGHAQMRTHVSYCEATCRRECECLGTLELPGWGWSKGMPRPIVEICWVDAARMRIQVPACGLIWNCTRCQKFAASCHFVSALAPCSGNLPVNHLHAMLLEVAAVGSRGKSDCVKVAPRPAPAQRVLVLDACSRFADLGRRFLHGLMRMRCCGKFL